MPQGEGDFLNIVVVEKSHNLHKKTYTRDYISLLVKPILEKKESIRKEQNYIKLGKLTVKIV